MNFEALYSVDMLNLLLVNLAGRTMCEFIFGGVLALKRAVVRFQHTPGEQ